MDLCILEEPNYNKNIITIIKTISIHYDKSTMAHELPSNC